MAKHKTVREVMTSDPITLPETASLVDAAKRMRADAIGDVVVLDGSQVCGIVTDRDIVVRGSPTAGTRVRPRSRRSAVST